MTDSPKYIPASEYLARQARRELHAHSPRGGGPMNPRWYLVLGVLCLIAAAVFAVVTR